MKQEFQRKEAEWEHSHEALKREAEERLTSMFLELREKAECEKQSIISRFELRESSMKHLQDQQAAQILDLERSLMEQQGRLRDLEQELTRDEALACSQCGQEPLVAQDEEHATLLREKEDCALQLMMAQNRWVMLCSGGFGVEPPAQCADRGNRDLGGCRGGLVGNLEGNGTSCDIPHFYQPRREGMCSTVGLGVA